MKIANAVYPPKFVNKVEQGTHLPPTTKKESFYSTWFFGRKEKLFLVVEMSYYEEHETVPKLSIKKYFRHLPTNLVKLRLKG